MDCLHHVGDFDRSGVGCGEQCHWSGLRHRGLASSTHIRISSPYGLNGHYRPVGPSPTLGGLIADWGVRPPDEGRSNRTKTWSRDALRSDHSIGLALASMKAISSSSRPYLA